MMDKKLKRFGLVLTVEDKAVLRKLAELERISEAAVVRRLIWKEATAQTVKEATCQS